MKIYHFFLALFLLWAASLSGGSLILVKEWDKAGKGKIDLPVAVDMDSNGNVYVLDQRRRDKGKAAIHVYSPNGKYLKSLPLKETELPAGLAIDSGGDIYVTDLSRDSILKYSPDGKFIKLWGGEGESKGRLSNPRDIIVDSKKNVYVTDEGNNRIVKFSPDGEKILCEFTDKKRRFAVRSICLLPGGILAGIVGEHQGNPLIFWKPDGTFRNVRCCWGRFPKPLDMTISGDNRLFISGFYSTIGSVDYKTAMNSRKLPNMIVYGNPKKIPRTVYSSIVCNKKNGDVYVLDKYAGKVLKFK